MTPSLLVIFYLSALLFFILCSILKILVLLRLLPCFGSRMKRLMKAYRNCSGATEGIVEYYNANRDLAILLDLLATNYGVGHAMAAMTLFDTVIITQYY